MCNIIIEKGAIKRLSDYLKENYENKNVAFVTTNKAFNNNKKYLQDLKNLPLKLNIYFVEDCVVCNNVFTMELSEHIKLNDFVVCFGVEAIIDCVKCVTTKLNIGYVLVPHKLKEGNYISSFAFYLNEDSIVEYIDANLPECIYVDTNIIINTCRRDVASAFSYVLSLNLCICKMMYENLDNFEVESIQNIFKGINMFTSENIVTNLGKVKLFKLMLEIQLKLNSLKIRLNNQVITSIYLKFYGNINRLSYGELNLIFTMLILSLHEKIINNKICLPPLNIEKRISRLKMLFNKDKYIEEAVNSIDISDNALNGFEIKKEEYLKNISQALNRVCNNMPMLKRIYLDKGIIFNSVNIDNFYNALSIACDIVKDKYLNVLASVGALDQ